MNPDLNPEPLSPEDHELGERLRQDRPLPHPGFRSMLRNRLLSEAGTTSAPAPRRLRLLIATYASGGLALLAVAAVGVFGAGPLAA
jgi:hypothetical protein